MGSKVKKEAIRLTPMSRLRMSFDTELTLDNGTVFGRETYEKYLEMQRGAEDKQAQLIKSLYVLDALLFLIISGQNWSVPGVAVEIASIPAVQEVLLFASALTFFFLCAFFITNQCYIAIIDQFGNRIVDSSRIDPDFFNASRKHFDFFLKIFRPKLNIWGEDFYQHNRGFAIFSWMLNLVVVLVVLTLPAAHLILSWVAAESIFASDLNIYGKYFLLCSVGLINLSGLAMVIGMSKEFRFNLIESAEEAGADVGGKSDQSN